MKLKLLFPFFLCWISGQIQGQTILVQPYLQDVSPNAIRILWETSTGDESLVEYGLSSDLGLVANGTAAPNNGSTRIHDVHLTGLERFTVYYYRVQTGAAQSAIYSFKTPPFASDEQSISLLAMSDMQKDGAEPTKFAEIIQDGVLPYIDQQYPDPLIEALNLVLIPGDLVATGNDYGSWKSDFFDPAQTLFRQVPVYPVLGNHENNTAYYFNYFHLPANGSPGFEEHWWYADYSNVRVIGLNSNPPYDTPGQLAWLEAVLADACQIDSIDFVFAELHHPHKSELWTPGESDFTGEVVNLLQEFSTNCGKPSIHFFGHTHAYSRGQSRDHKHMWVNVATAGGAIDNWGEFPNFDYAEFSKSQDEYGFVLVDVAAGDDPAFTLRRISRGNQAQFRDNELRDSLTIHRYDISPEIPVPVFPIEEVVSPDCVLLEAQAFSSIRPEAVHGASQWQVALNCDFADPIFDSWKQYENWYNEIDTQADDALHNEQVNNLLENTDYCWRVRYRDRQLNWSAWTEGTHFTTGLSEISQNLLVNPGAEAGVFGWTPTVGILEALQDGECDGISPNSGDYYFAVGGVCTDGPFGECTQLTNVVSFANEIDNAEIQVNYGGFMSDYAGSDLPEMQLYFMDESGVVLDSTPVLSTLNSGWTEFNEWADIPASCRLINFTLRGTRNAGNDNDSYFDDLFLRLGKKEVACSEYVLSPTKAAPDRINKLEIYPNPFMDQATIKIPEPGKWELLVINQMGVQVDSFSGFGQTEVILQRRDLPAGIYFVKLNVGLILKGIGMLVVEGG
ncbi:MAG: fibronectin type III domain-containing protein [Saprospiraceae bacterium]|nr:fibronectin type III domain-containing protein [Saprospiraceae bacterium]